MTAQRNIQKTVLIIISIMALILGVWSFKRYQESRIPALDQIQATVLTPPRTIPTFVLHYGNKQTFTDTDLQGHWTFMFFGYTRCPDICPTTMAVLNNTYTLLHQSNQALPHVVFVSVDPERDNNEYLERYVHYFNDAFTGVTGKPKEIEALTQSLGVVFQKVTPNGEAYHGQTPTYLIDHSGVILLFNPQGQLRALFSMPHEAPEMAKAYAVILAHSTAQ